MAIQLSAINIQMKSTKLTLNVGDSISRTKLHEVFGGQRQSGISTSATTTYVMIFSMPPSSSNPYSDGWLSDGHFHYKGQGQSG